MQENRIGRAWLSLPDCRSLLEAISNLDERSVKNVPMGVLDYLPSRINECLGDKKISSEDAEAAISKLNSLRPSK